MLKQLQRLRTRLNKLNVMIEDSCIECDELTIEVAAENIQTLCFLLRDEDHLKFDILIDVCGVDYLHYGLGEWETNTATATGFSRGAEV